jgi:hypothetical protein
VEVTESDGLPVLKYRFGKSGWQRLEKTLLGKTLLFSLAQHHMINLD